MKDAFDIYAWNKKRYLVYINIDDSQVLWKAIDDMSCIVEIYLNF